MPALRRTGRARREVSAGGVVFRQAATGLQFALIRAGGHWSFPKGNIEKAETPEIAALREISEETGLPLEHLRVVRRLPDVEYAFRWTGILIFKTVHNFLVELTGDSPFNPQLSEIEGVEWFAADAARRTISFQNSRGTLDAAIAAIEARRVAS